MAFTDQQTRQLKAKLDSQFVKTRRADGATLHYIEGWHAIAEANRIFGFDGWDRRTLVTNCIWTGTSDQLHSAAYIAKVRVYVRAGDITVIREGSGTGEGKAPTQGQAHEIALKSAETDATKRALATFGNVFGLALYDRGQAGVRQTTNSKRTEPIPKGPWHLNVAHGGKARQFAKPSEFVEALKAAMAESEGIERLFDVWEQNVQTVRELNAAREKLGLEPGFAQALVAHLKSCAVSLVRQPVGSQGLAEIDSESGGAGKRPKIDKSVLTIGEPKRIRSKAHLRFVASHPCLICGRTPSHAHHIRYAQPRGLSLKVSDEFTVPLCAIHHSENHATGDERTWWERHKIDPLAIARALWSRGRMPPTAPTVAPGEGSDLKPASQ
jgi:DNA recombination protein Rad52